MPRIDANKLTLEERVVQINRVAKVVKGGRRFSFSAVIVVGDGAGHVGVGLGKAGEVPEAIRKGVEDAKKNIIKIPMVGTTIPHEVRTVFSASNVLLKPASQGTGVIAGGSVRAVVEAAGIRDILSKVYGSTNPVNVTRATLEGLRSLHSAAELSARRGVPVRLHIAGPAGRGGRQWPRNASRHPDQELDQPHRPQPRDPQGARPARHRLVGRGPRQRRDPRHGPPGPLPRDRRGDGRRGRQGDQVKLHDLKPAPGLPEGEASRRTRHRRRARARPRVAAPRARRRAPAGRSRPGSRAARRRSTSASPSCAASEPVQGDQYEVVNVGDIARARRGSASSRAATCRAAKPASLEEGRRPDHRQPGDPPGRRPRPPARPADEGPRRRRACRRRCSSSPMRSAPPPARRSRRPAAPCPSSRCPTRSEPRHVGVDAPPAEQAEAEAEEAPAAAEAPALTRHPLPTRRRRRGRGSIGPATEAKRRSRGAARPPRPPKAKADASADVADAR